MNRPNFKALKTNGRWTILANLNTGAIEKFRVVRNYEPTTGCWSSGTGHAGLISAVQHFKRETG